MAVADRLTGDDIARFGSDPARMFAANRRTVQERIAAACRRSGRRPEDVRLLPVTKTVPAQVLRLAFAAGITDFGEKKRATSAPPSRIWRSVGASSAICKPTR